MGKIQAQTGRKQLEQGNLQDVPQGAERDAGLHSDFVRADMRVPVPDKVVGRIHQDRLEPLQRSF